MSSSTKKYSAAKTHSNGAKEALLGDMTKKSNKTQQHAVTSRDKIS